MKSIAALPNLKDEINFFKQELNNLLYSQRLDSEEVIRLSEKLDELITEYHKVRTRAIS